jgi:hypothetical protein
VDRLPLDVILIRSAPWSERNGRVVVEREQPRVRDLGSLRRWVRWAWLPKRVKLDELGSAVWRRLDGRATVAAVADSLRAEFPDCSEALDARLGDFVGGLGALGLVRIDSDCDN